MEAVEEAFDLCGKGTFTRFAAYVEEEIGALGHLRGLDEADLRGAVQDFFARGDGTAVSTLRRSRCAAALAKWAGGESSTAAPRPAAQELRRRGAAPAVPAPADAEDKPKPQQQQLPQLTEKEQLCLDLFKAVLTIILFTILQHLYRTYIDPPFSPKQPNIEEIIAKLQAEGSVTEVVNGP
eukprot:TRINITY_DN2716_c0_g3_i1.p1 TRINITY_DN2716_c0_g3~~TRINITY_DN2716_c0_g3_i1.p1  ORF type:complete len:181 (+),score=66.81 TRINITY_DN2716_c0_g3_i1:39-581(+)